MTGERGSSIARSLASSWLALGVGVAVSFFLSPFVVNKLGAAWYGVWAVAGQLVGYMYLLDFGVRESVIRYTSKYAARGRRDPLNRVLTAAVTLYAGITLLTLMGVALCVWRLPYWLDLDPVYWTDTRWAVGLGGLTIAQTFLFNVFNGIVFGLRRWDIGNAIGIGWNFLRAGLIVYFLMRGHGIVALATIQLGVSVLSGLTSVAISTVLLRRRGMAFGFARLTGRQFRALSRRLLGYGAYVIINNVGEKVIHASGAVIAGLFQPIQAVAHYAIAGSLMGYLRSLLSATSQVFNPLASHLRELRQGEELKAAFLLGVKLVVLLTMPVAMAFVVLGERFIGLWMGAEFAQPSGEVLRIMAAAAILSSPQYVFSSVLYGISRHNVIAALRIGEASVNLVLSIALVRTIGLAGVAIGGAIPSVLIVAVVMPLVACRIVGVGLAEYYAQAYLRPALAIAPFAAAAWWVQQDLPAPNLAVFFLHMAVLTAIYAPCAFLIVLNARERQFVLERIGLRAALRPGDVR
ncbi:MAG: oligosaccharide flippase family protein [Steroidobacteraceae bacterium]|nr:oligosaccharide flippase family protein [Steroidobacteraceae bacterium]